MAMKKLWAAAAFCAAMLAVPSIGMSAETTLTVSMIGPGGHSNGDYGNTNAVHAGARAAMAIAKAVPDAVISCMQGGVSVNAIAGDCSFTVTLTGDDAAVKADEEKVRKAVAEGVAAENAFRGVKKGDQVKGVPAEIRAVVQKN